MEVAVESALLEIDALQQLSPAEHERDHEREQQLKSETMRCYFRLRGFGATDEEAALVWRTLREDLLREVRALEMSANKSPRG